MFSPQLRRTTLPNPVQVRGWSCAGDTGKDVGLGGASGLLPGAAASGEVVNMGSAGLQYGGWAIWCRGRSRESP